MEVPSLSVTGKVLAVDGTVPSNTEVRIFCVVLRVEQLLGTVKISPTDGSYIFKYSVGAIKPTRPGKTTADLKVYAFKTVAPNTTPIATSEITFNAPPSINIDLVVGGTDVIGLSEYDRLVAAIKPVIDSSKIEMADLVENADHQDISFLVGETGELESDIQVLILASQYERQTQISANIFYGILKVHSTDDLKSLASLSPIVLQQILQTAMATNIINLMTDASLQSSVDSLQKLATQLSTTATDLKTPSALGSLLSTQISNPAAFVNQLGKFDGKPATFWSALQANPDVKDKVGNIQFSVQLGVMTLTHMPLVTELQNQQKAGVITIFSDLTKYRQTDWLAMVQKPNIGVPPSVPGNTDAEKALRYSQGIANLLEDTFPTKFIASRFNDSDDDTIHGPLNLKTDMASFFQKNPTFDVLSNRITDFVLQNPDSMKSIADPESLKLQIATVQRVYSIAPRYDQMRALLNNEFTSSMSISQLGRSMFINSMSSKIGASNALQIFEKARQNHAMSVHLWTFFGSKFRPPYLPVIPPGTSKDLGQKAIPDWETLFGSADSCSCDQCKSLAGPAAYFVDILHFLKNRFIIDESKTTRDKDGNITSVVWQKIRHGGEDGHKYTRTAKDVLFQRRADLGEIQLTCKNTNTPVPYIDLTLEILEDFISPLPGFTPFFLPVGSVESLDKKSLTEVAALFRGHTQVPLSDFATISVIKPGLEWNIDEPGYTYFLLKYDSPTFPVQVASRSKQTKGTNAELATYPQYVNAVAYNTLAQETYPIGLPFDLWSSSVQTYLAHENIERHNIMEVFSLQDRLGAISDPLIVLEHLKLTAAEANIILGQKDASGAAFKEFWQLFGFSKESLDVDSAIPDPADVFHPIKSGAWFQVLTSRLDVFFQQTKLTYLELLNFVEVGAVLDVNLRLQVAPGIGQPADTCDMSKLQLIQASPTSIYNLIRLYRLQQKLEGWTIIDVARALQSAQLPSDIPTMQQILLRISCINRLSESLGLSILDICAFWMPLESQSYKDYVNEDDDEPKPSSQYEQIFRNRTISSHQDQVLPADPTKLSGKLSENTSPITASLSISIPDLNLLLKTSAIVPDDSLTLENLSRLFRHVKLLTALELSVSDYLIVLQLIGVDPFNSPAGTVIFVERVNKVKDSAFTLPQVNYILRNALPPVNNVSMSEEAIALILGDLRQGLSQIALDNMFSEDLNDSKGDLTKKKLALLNWDGAVIAVLVGILNDVTSYQVKLAQPLPANLISQFPPELGNALTYEEGQDGASPTISFSRIMTKSESETLNNLSNATTDFQNAINSLFEMPSVLLQRNMSSFSTRQFSVKLAQVPAQISIPTSLSKKVYWNNVESTLYSIGALSVSEREVLLGGTSDPSLRQAILDLYQLPSIQAVPLSDQFLIASDISFLVDTSKSRNSVANFTKILSKLLPYLLNNLSNQLVKQTLSGALSIPTKILDPLLSQYLIISGNPINSLFRDVTFATSNKNITITPASFPSQFNSFRLLEKVSMICNGCKMGLDELQWLYSFRKAGDPSVAWLDFNSLPVSGSSINNPNFSSWERTITLFRTRDLFSNGKEILNFLFASSHSSMVEADFLATLSNMASWDINDLKTIVGPTGLNLTFPVSYQDEIGLSRIFNGISMTRNIGCSVSNAILLAGSTVTENLSRITRQAIKSKYDQDTWNTIARPLQNILREKQRSALVSYILSHQRQTANTTWRNSNDVYAYFLIDVDQGPCAFTSRIKQAIGAVQTFTQRCLLNLEADVEANTEVDDGWLEWDLYLKSSLLTAANREILCYPENYMESSLRDDKSPFFLDLENDLKQNPVTQDTVEQVISTYLDSLDTVAHLQVLSYYHQKEGVDELSPAIDILHVFARTRSVPFRYYYAKRLDKKTWTPWEKVNVDIQGEHLLPLIWNRRLHIFWALFTPRQPSQNSISVPGPGGTIPASPSFMDVQLAWSEFRMGKWTAKTVSDQVASLRQSGTTLENLSSDDFKQAYSLRSSGGEKGSTLSICALTTMAYWSNRHHSRRPDQAQFLFLDVKGTATVTVDRHILTPLQPFAENAAMSYKVSDANLWLPNLTSNVVALRKVPNYSDPRLIFAPQYYNPSLESPFFFQLDYRLFFIEPRLLTTRIQPRFDLAAPSSVNPSLLEGGLLSKYLALPNLPVKLAVFPSPVDVGASKFIQSGEFASTVNTAATAVSPPNANANFLTVNRITNFSTPSTRLVGLKVPIIRPFPIRPVPIIQPPIKPILHKNPLFPTLTIPAIQIKLGYDYKFSTLYHPYVTEFIRQLNRDGLDGLYQRPLQLSHQSFFEAYDPNSVYIDGSNPQETVDFSGTNMYSLYNWELFFHVPLMIAEQLSTNQQFKDAQKWFHYIFNPTDTSSLPAPRRFWQMGLFSTTSSTQYQNETLPNILSYLAKGGTGATLSDDEARVVANMQDVVVNWRKNPFDPYLIARSRTTAFQRMVVMKYLDNLIAWGDQLFRQDSIESINEATEIYILASEILGGRPSQIPPRTTPAVQTFNSIASSLDSTSNALVKIEEIVSATNIRANLIIPIRYRPHVAPPTMLYFCIPDNPKLLSYWDTVADRLFKIRNCMNLQGKVRQLALFEPPIDPSTLVRAAASGVDLTSAMNDLNVPLSQYRYSTLAAKAAELASHVKEFGRSFLEALEKRDSYAMSLLQSQNEIDYLNLVTAAKSQAVDEAQSAKDALTKGKDVVTAKQTYYQGKSLTNSWEDAHLVMEVASTIFDIADSGAQPVSAVLHIIPDAKLGAPTSIGLTWGGSNAGKGASKFGTFMGKLGTILKHASSMVQEMGSYHQRKDEWDHQGNLATLELLQVTEQINGADIRHQIAMKDLTNHNKQLENSTKINELMRSKFTNGDLYDWMVSQLAAAYFQGYQMAYDAAKRAERAFCLEVGLDQTNYIQFGHWDSLKKGLLAGEQLQGDLLRLESAFLEQNKREYEITQNISLAQIDPVALIQLRSAGECFFGFSEAIFDVNYPGHYLRRLKSVAITIPSIVGPYTSVSATLSLQKSSTRVSSLPSNSKYARRDNDLRFRDNYEQSDSICTSHANMDSGLFELSLRDERYLPFEYAGAISSWRLTLPMKFRQFDYSSISDVIFQVRYTAREGGDALKSLVETELQTRALAAVQMAEGQSGLGKLFQLRRDFPDDFYRLTRPATPSSPQEMTMVLSMMHIPYMMTAAKSVSITKASVYVQVAASAATTVTASSLHLSLRAKGTPRGDSVKLGSVYNGLLKATTDLKIPWGPITLTVWTDTDPVPQDAIEDVALVLYYTTTW